MSDNTISDTQLASEDSVEIARLREENRFLKENLSACRSNLYNFIGIIDQISYRISNQLLGNAEVLKHTAAKDCRDGRPVIDSDGKPVELSIFQANSIDLLICNPIQLVLGRFNGLKKAMADLKNRIQV